MSDPIYKCPQCAGKNGVHKMDCHNNNRAWTESIRTEVARLREELKQAKSAAVDIMLERDALLAVADKQSKDLGRVLAENDALRAVLNESLDKFKVLVIATRKATIPIGKRGIDAAIDNLRAALEDK